MFSKFLIRTTKRNIFSPLTQLKHNKKLMTKSDSKLLIPGPITLSTDVIKSLGIQSISHTSELFTQRFQSALKKLRQVYGAHETKGQPIIISGSGTLGFDLIGANLIKPKTSKILVLSTGFFSDELYDCLSQHYVVDPSSQVTRLASDHAGATIPLDSIETELQENEYDLIAMTHVDTSTGVLLDIEKVAEIVHRVSPQTLIAVDTVCSLGCETIKFNDWKLDICISASQKAIGAPPGLSLGMLSDRAIERSLIDKKTNGTGSYYASIKKWLPVLKSFENGTATYFATPPVQLINSLDTALTEILQFEYKNKSGIDARILKHKDVSNQLKEKITTELGLKLVTDSIDISAHGLTAIYVKHPTEVINFMANHGYIIAGGIHRDIKSQYIRIGHMGVSACDDSLGHMTGVILTLSKAESNKSINCDSV